MSYERYGSRSGSFFFPYLMGVVIGLGIGNVGHAIADGNTADKIRDTQIANEQIESQLELTHRVGRLVLDPKHMTFTFETVTQDGAAQSCNGTYEQNNNAAQVTGDLTCSQTVAGPGK